MNKLNGTIVGGAVGVIIGIIGLLLLWIEASLTHGNARTPLMIIITLVLFIIGAVVGYFMLGKKETTKTPANAVPSKMTKTRIVTVIAMGIIVGAVLAFLIGGALIYYEGQTMGTKVNGWSAILNNGKWGNNILERAAIAQVIPAANLPEEAVYWSTTKDSTGARLSGTHDYIMHFPAGGFPPNNAFWSLTMEDSKYYMVNNSINRYNFNSFSNLTPNADGSVDIYIQNAAPSGNVSNWLPAPSGNFILWLRAYLPGPAVLNGSYQVPPVVEVS